MMAKDKNKPVSLSWEQFQQLGNPDNAPELPDEINKEEYYPEKDVIRIFLERKGRGGKTVTLIRGFTAGEDTLDDLGKDLKAKCGVGGTSSEGEILLQGDQREKVMNILKSKGYRDVKKSGG